MSEQMESENSKMRQLEVLVKEKKKKEQVKRNTLIKFDK